MKPVVAVVGAFDRFNFGDLLFPQAVRFGFEKLNVDAEYRHYSLRAADLRDRGGVLTEPLAALSSTDLPPGSVVVVAGGEVLSARWLDAFAGLAGPRRTLAAKVVARMIGSRPVDGLCRLLLGGDRPQPWVLDARDIGHDLPVTYNAVGGIGVGRLPESLCKSARVRLGRASFLGVRDPDAKATLDGWDLPLEVTLTPDSAVVMSEAFPLAAIARANVHASLSRLGPDYVAFQVGRYPAWGQVQVLADELRKIQQETGFGILLLPLGQAAGHEDGVALQEIARLLSDLPVAFLPAPDVRDILACIAGARLFIGSSLHGNLMALIYRVPHVGFGQRVLKLDLMMRTWDPTAPDGVAFPTSIADCGLRVLDAGAAALSEAAAVLRAAAMSSFEKQSRLLS